ncbi:hypothetical protein DKX38_007655 [Salix brachista]|uniref:non-specific serine/threonine protein kinase n=1 Tax=Salix brachista TaxID=2182728 RepID=A0A5N5MRD2_9ROSI|nr:hypothetical protein DKX38_007655 [Salix brachista]
MINVNLLFCELVSRGCGGLGSLKAETLSLRRFQLEEYLERRATKNFSDDRILGSGAFGNVYKGTFEVEGTARAIKRAHAESYQSTEEFRNESCDMEMMLKMGKLCQRCVVKNPKDRPAMTRVWQELEEALYLAANFVLIEPSKDYWRSSSSSRRSMDRGPRRSSEYENSQSFVSIDGVGFQRFRVEMDSIFFHSKSIKCLEISSVSIDIDKSNLRGISEETSKEEIS